MHSLGCPPGAEQPIGMPKAVPECALETANADMAGRAAANIALIRVLSCREVWRTSSGARTAATAASPGSELNRPATGSAARNSFSASATTCAPWEKPGAFIRSTCRTTPKVVEQKSPALQGWPARQQAQGTAQLLNNKPSQVQ